MFISNYANTEKLCYSLMLIWFSIFYQDDTLVNVCTILIYKENVNLKI